jgi:hypothetical protein
MKTLRNEETVQKADNASTDNNVSIDKNDFVDENFGCLDSIATNVDDQTRYRFYKKIYIFFTNSR